MKTIAVDWDGTLVEYNGWGGPGEFGPAIPSMVERVKEWLANGDEVIIFTSRLSWEHGPQNVNIAYQAIKCALEDMGLPLLFVTANKYIRISEFWDDRAVRVERNTGICCEDLGTIQRT